MSIPTSTISGNKVIARARSAFDGGISNMPRFNDTSTLKMVNDTVAGNQAGQAGLGGGIENDDSEASVALTNVNMSRDRAGPRRRRRRPLQLRHRGAQRNHPRRKRRGKHLL